jgi:hypothetical protein
VICTRWAISRDLGDLAAIAEIPGKILALALDVVVGRGSIH